MRSSFQYFHSARMTRQSHMHCPRTVSNTAKRLCLLSAQIDRTNSFTEFMRLFTKVILFTISIYDVFIVEGTFLDDTVLSALRRYTPNSHIS